VKIIIKKLIKYLYLGSKTLSKSVCERSGFFSRSNSLRPITYIASVLQFQLLWVPKETSSTPTTRILHQQLDDAFHRPCMDTQQLTDFLGAHESSNSLLGDIFRRRPSITIYFLWSLYTRAPTTQIDEGTLYSTATVYKKRIYSFPFTCIFLFAQLTGNTYSQDCQQHRDSLKHSTLLIQCNARASPLLIQCPILYQDIDNSLSTVEKDIVMQCLE
jgi:hypothetical protein